MFIWYNVTLIFLSLCRAIFVLVNSLELTAVKTALLIRDDHGLQYLFVIPAVAILFSAIYSAIFMPETHGLSLKEIGALYSAGKPEVIFIQIINIIMYACKCIKIANSAIEIYKIPTKLYLDFICRMKKKIPMHPYISIDCEVNSRWKNLELSGRCLHCLSGTKKHMELNRWPLKSCQRSWLMLSRR